MEETTKLNIGNKTGCPIAPGKLIKNGKGKLAEKTFEKLMRQLVDDRVKAGKESGILNVEIAENSFNETGIEAISRENLSLMFKNRVFPDLDRISTEEKPFFEEEEPECIAGDGVIIETASLVDRGKVELVSLVHQAELSEIPKALPISEEEAKDVCFGFNTGSTEDLMGNHPVKAAYSGRNTIMPRAVWTGAEAIETSGETVGGVDVDNAKKTLPQNFNAGLMVGSESREMDLRESKKAFMPLAGASGKLRALEPEKAQISSEGAMGKSVDELLHSAREQSLMNRLTQIIPKEIRESKAFGIAKPENEQKGEANEKTFVLVKDIIPEGAEAKSAGKQDAKRQLLDSNIKKFEGMPINAQKNSAQEISGTGTSNSPRTIENLDEISGKIEFGMDRVRENGESVIRVRLRPEELGRIEIRLVQENGIVKGSILVENEGVKEQMCNLLLEDKFLQALDGIKPKEIEVGVFNQQTGTFKDFGQGASDFQKESRSGGFSDDSKETRDNVWQGSEEGQDIQKGLDLFA